mgnify:CR=1 FL=1
MRSHTVSNSGPKSDVGGDRKSEGSTSSRNNFKQKYKNITMSGIHEDLPDISEVSEVSEEDKECIREVKEVLEKYGKSSRFGLTLLHSHFPVDEDEILVEVCDPENRTLTTKPKKKSEVDIEGSIKTSWRLDKGEAMVSCDKVCVMRGTDHRKRHH